MQLLKDKIALVTGGTAGIGREIALAFARQGAHVTIFGTHEQRAQLVLQLLESCRISAEQNFFSKLVDVSDKKAVDLAIQEMLSQQGRVDILVNNAGITHDGLLMKMGEDDWD